MLLLPAISQAPIPPSMFTAASSTTITSHESIAPVATGSDTRMRVPSATQAVRTVVPGDGPSSWSSAEKRHERSDGAARFGRRATPPILRGDADLRATTETVTDRDGSLAQSGAAHQLEAT